MRRAFGHRRRLLMCAGAILVVSVGVAYAAIPSRSGVINGCYKGDDIGGGKGQLRVIDAEKGESCKKNEIALSWNQKGDPGAQGIQGIQGPKGDQGLKGDKGDKGDTGAQGIQGLKGDKGDTGDQGLQGLKGDKGDTGDQGLQGLKGDKGDPGEPGADGEDGADGAGLESLDQLDGLPCMRGGDEGTSELTYDNEGYARVQCVVISEPPPCVDSTLNGSAASAISLGSVSGDTGSGSSAIERTASLCGGSDWWRVEVTEDEHINAFFAEDLTVGIAVEPTSGDPNLYLYCGSGPNLVGSSANSGLGVEIVQVGKLDNLALLDDFYVLIEVRGSTVPTDYTLLITGDVSLFDDSC